LQLLGRDNGGHIGMEDLCAVERSLQAQGTETGVGGTKGWD